MNILRHSLELGGLAAIGVGCWLIYPPAAWIWAGICLELLAACLLILRKTGSENRQP